MLACADPGVSFPVWTVVRTDESALLSSGTMWAHVCSRVEAGLLALHTEAAPGPPPGFGLNGTALTPGD